MSGTLTGKAGRATAKPVELGFGGLRASAGDHIGHFYRTKAEWKALVIPFLSSGLKSKHKCIYLVSTESSQSEIQGELATEGIDVEGMLVSGQLVFDEGRTTPEELQQCLNRALAEVPDRFSLLRWAGDMTWSLRKLPTRETLMEWETHCNVIENPRAVFLCQYDLSSFRGDVVLDALKTHPLCIVSNVIHQNPYYVEPEALLDELRHRVSAPLARLEVSPLTADTANPDGRALDSGVAHPLWTFLTAISGVTDELEQARLIATGLPSLVPCDLSAVALLNAAKTSSHLVLQKDGEQFTAARTEQILPELEPVFQEAFARPPVVVATAQGDPGGCNIPPSVQKLGIERLALVPLMTVAGRLGTLVVGRKGANTFSRADEMVLATLGEQTAIGIENLRLHKSLQKYTQTLQRQNELILQAAGEGIYGLDAEGKTTFVNPAAAKMLGWNAEALIGQPMHDFHHHSRPDGSNYPQEECPIYAAFKDGKVHRVDDEVFWRKDGSSFPVEYTSTPIFEDGKLVGAVVVFRDITERKRAEEALRNALTEVKQLKERLQAENIYLQEEIKTQHNFEEIVGSSTALQEVLRKVEQVGATDATVLIHGETGTGKELIARAIHNLSPRKDRPLVKVNCGAISAGLVESELFGHEKGAFTGALQQRTGRFELANGGTIFLDEVGELPLDTQVKLLRVLQEQEFERVGSSRPIKVDVRIIAATNRNLSEQVKAGKFRMDLFYRLNVFPLDLPPLRERSSDVPLIVNHVLAKLSKKLGKPLNGVSSKTMDYLMRYPWPGNVRELENIIERAAIVTRGPVIEIDEALLPVAKVAREMSSSAKTLEDVERVHILSVLEKTHWVISGERGAAACLGLNPNTLRSRLQKLGIKKPAPGA